MGADTPDDLLPPNAGAAASDGEDDDSMSDFSDTNEYMLGFATDAPARSLLRHQFPSKLGGRPAWLDPVALPSPRQLTCGASGQPLNFLLQVYATLDDEVAHEQAFHRSLFVFVTPQGQQVASPGAVRAFRCQLPRKNPYYSFDPPSEKQLLPPPLKAEQVQQSAARDPWKVLDAEALLGASAASTKDSEPKGGSKKVSGGAAAASSGADGAASGLASLDLQQQQQEAKEQQQGPAEAQGTSSGPGGSTSGGAGGLRLEARAGAKHALILYPERELVVEPEDRPDEEEEQATVQKLLDEYQARVAEEGELTEEELPEEVLEQVEQTHTVERRHFALFQARMELAPEQVVRYCFQGGARPLWPSPHGVPKPEQIPPCPHCKQPRRFEFQVMPQLLNELDQDELSPAALDWSTIVVYTCPTSCTQGPAAALRDHGSNYVEEFVWVQPGAEAQEA